jgi:uncharacterized protein
MNVQSAYNVLVPVTEGSQPFYALFNTLAGSIDVLDCKVASALENYPSPRRKVAGEYSKSSIVPLRRLTARRTEPCALAPDVVNYLDRRGYLFSSFEEESRQARTLYETMLEFHRQAARQPIVVIPSYNCDLKCPYCWQRQYDMDSPVMAAEVAEAMFHAIPRLLDANGSSDHADIVIFGGEPLQDEPKLRERVLHIAALARAAGISTKVITNGVGLAAAVPHIEGFVDLVQVTIDGIGEIHRKRRPLPSIGGVKRDSFAPMVEGVTRAMNAGIRVNLRINLDSVNLPTLPALSDFMKDQGWLASGLVKPYLAPVKNHNRNKETSPETLLLRALMALVEQDPRMSVYDTTGFPGIKYFQGFKESGLFSLHRFFNCEAQINFFALDLHGDVYACWDAAGIKEHAVGRFVPEISVDEERLARWRGRSSIDIEGCSGCGSSPHCGGGCQFLSFEHAGTFQESSCDSMMDGYIYSIIKNSEWLIERARANDHAVGLVTSEGLLTAVDRPFGLMDKHQDPSELLTLCG